MPLFDAANSREQRSLANNRLGTLHPQDVSYNVSFARLDRDPKQLISFASSTGHAPHGPGGGGSAAPDVVYTPNEAAVRPRPKGAVRFGGMGAGHPDGNERTPTDPRNLYLGVGLTTLELAAIDLKYKFARPLSKGAAYCDFSKMPARSTDPMGGGSSGLRRGLGNRSELNVKYSVVDKNVPRVMMRPSSAAPAAGDDAAAAVAPHDVSMATDGSLFAAHHRSRPHSAAAAVHDGSSSSSKTRPTSGGAASPSPSLATQQQQQQQQGAGSGGGSGVDGGPATASPGAAGSAADASTGPTTTTTAGGGGASALTSPNASGGLRRPWSSCSRQCTAKAFEQLFAAMTVAEAEKLRKHRHGNDDADEEEQQEASRNTSAGKAALLASASGVLTSAASQVLQAQQQQQHLEDQFVSFRGRGGTLADALDPMKAFNASRRSVARAGTFSKAKR